MNSLDFDLDDDFICSFCGASHEHDDEALNCCRDLK